MAQGVYRPRRLREKPLLRKMVRETALTVDDLVYPLFVVHGRGVRPPGRLGERDAGGGSMIQMSRPTFGQEEEQAVLEVMRSGQLAQGERVRAFVRDPGAARPKLGENVELAVGDLADPRSVCADSSRMTSETTRAKNSLFGTPLRLPLVSPSWS